MRRWLSHVAIKTIKKIIILDFWSVWKKEQHENDEFKLKSQVPFFYFISEIAIKTGILDMTHKRKTIFDRPL